MTISLSTASLEVRPLPLTAGSLLVTIWPEIPLRPPRLLRTPRLAHPKAPEVPHPMRRQDLAAMHLRLRRIHLQAADTHLLDRPRTHRPAVVMLLPQAGIILPQAATVARSLARRDSSGATDTCSLLR